jgi:hypothetical protein
MALSRSVVPDEVKPAHPIVILISPPRSLSTAFLRMISARGDFTCLHEYFSCCYAQKNEATIVGTWLRQDAPLPKTFAEIKNVIFETAKKSPVFVKEMSWPMLNWPKLDHDFTGVQEWGELKNKELTDHWHGNAIQSTSFSKQKSYKVDEQGNPTFSEITNQDDKEACRKAYTENLHYYNLLLAETDNLLKPIER